MEFINALISSSVVSLESFIFYGAGIIGMIAHYSKKRLKKQTVVGIKSYFGTNNPLSSIKTFVAFAGTMSGMVLGLDVATLGIWVVLILGVAVGWTIDSGINDVKEPEEQ